MKRPEIHIMGIHTSEVESQRKVMECAHTLADYADWQIYKRPFNGSMKDSWTMLATFNIYEAVIYSESSVETWQRHETHWDVVITNFIIKVPIIN